MLTLFVIGSIFVNEDEGFLGNRIQPVLLVESKGHAGHIFVNGELQGHNLLLPNLYFIYLILFQVICFKTMRGKFNREEGKYEQK